MAKFKTNSLISGIVWGVVLHVGINVILPQLKNLDVSNLFGSAGATPDTPAPVAPAPEEEPTEPEDPEMPLEDEPMEGDEEDEEEFGDEEEEEEEEEDPTAGGTSRRGGGGSGSRRGGSGSLNAQRARMRSMLARRYWR